MRILVVDDSVHVHHQLRVFLTADGHEDLAFAFSAREAFELLGLDDDTPSPAADLVLMDIEMGEMGGIEATRRLKADPRYQDVPIIMITADTSSESLQASFEAGAVDYIIKPIRKIELLARVRSFLRLREEVVTRIKRNDEVQRTYEDLKRVQAQLLQQDKMASIGQLAAGVAHEINNPMGFIISNLGSLGKYVEKLAAYLDADEKLLAGCDPAIRKIAAQERQKHKVDYIRKDMPNLIAETSEGAQRVRQIVQDLKSFSRVDGTEFVHADINEGLDSTLSIAWNELKYKATVTKDYGQAPQVWCNPGQLNQVFLNILVNAAHAIVDHGEIRIKTREEGDSVRIAISDTGGGIPPENVKRIFDPFFTTKEVGKGTGLGLSIAYDIVVNKHGGRIDVTSEVGEGTTFSIMLPMKRE